MQNFFMPDIKRLVEVDKAMGVDILRRLLQVTSSRCGLNPQEITVSTNLDAPDGGVDGKIETDKEIDPSLSLQLFSTGCTVYQVKTGKFSASNKQNRRSLLFKNPAKPDFSINGLLPGIKDCLEKNGTFISFLISDDNPDAKGINPVDEMRKDLVQVDKKYENAKIKILKANQVAHLISFFPSLSLSINQKRGNVYKLNYIAERCGLDIGDYLKTSEHILVIEQLHSILYGITDYKHIRIVGEPGIGKTRLIYEAAITCNIADLCIYVPNADVFLSSSIIDDIYENVATYPIVLIVDECDPTNRSELHRKFKNIKKPMVLITIHNELDEQDEGSNEYLFLMPPPLTNDEISTVLQSYGLPLDDANHIATYCSGSPRVGHVVGRNLREHPEMTHITKLNGIENIWDVYIADRHASSEEKRVRKLVLTYLALFKKFGWAQEVQQEAKQIWQLIRDKADHTLSWDQFIQVIEDFKKRKILQGFSTLYITPKLFHIKLWCDWWDKYGASHNIPELLNLLKNSHLFHWFADMVVYVRESTLAREHLEKLLTVNGFFDELSGFDDYSGGILFMKLASVLPKATVRAVLRALGNYQQDLLNFTNGRRSIVHALEVIALHGDCFIDAVEALQKLAISENEQWSNNATGVFADLFTLGRGESASTELSPVERLPVLINYLKSDNEKSRKLALQAFDEALRISLTRTLIRKRVGLHHDPKGWMPKTYGELHDIYNAYAQALWKAYKEYLTGQDKITAADILTKHLRTFLSTKIKTFENFVIEILENLAEEKNQDIKTKAIETIVTILRYDGNALNKSIKNKLHLIHDNVVDASFSSKLKRYVGLNLLEDRYSRDGKQSKIMNNTLQLLVDESFKQLDQFEKELSWLVTNDAKNGFEFGKKLGLSDELKLVWPKIKGAWLLADNRSDFFIGGFLAGIFENNKSLWESYIQEISNSPAVSQLPYLVLRSGMSENIATLLLDLAKNNAFDSSEFGIFIYGGVTKNIPKNILIDILKIMASTKNRKNIYSALEIINSLIYNDYMPEIIATEVCFDILSHHLLFTPSPEKKIDTMKTYAWKETAISLAKNDIDKSIPLARICLEHLGEDGTIAGGYQSDAWEFLDYVTTQKPEKLWPIIANYIDPMKSSGFNIMQWLSEGLTSKTEENTYIAFNALPKESIFKWIDENPDKRSVIMARFAPFSLSTYNQAPKSFIREILERYGSSTEVKNAVSANYNTGSWWGPASSHFREKLNLLEQYKATEQNTNVLSWLTEEINNLTYAIEKAKMREERDE